MKALTQVLQVDQQVLTQRRRDCYIRPLEAYVFCRFGALTQRQVAEIFGVRSGVAISLQIRKDEEVYKKDRALQAHLGKIEALLSTKLYHKG